MQREPNPDRQQDMRTRLLCLAVPALALVACSLGPVTPGTPSPVPTTTPATPIQTTSVPSTTPPPGVLTRFDTAELTDAGRRLTLHFVGGAVYKASDRCSHDYAGWAEQVGDVLEVAVVDVTPHKPVACDAIGYGRSLSIQLAGPFVGSRLNDLAGYVHFVRAPDGLLELRGLPVGWLLRAEGDVEESPTGRWQRTYSPQPNPRTGTSRNRIDFYQAFDGPAGVTGGDEQRTVTVNGQNSTLYRFAPDGELVLVWAVGPDGLALVVNEADFSVGQLISLAESATPG